MPSIRVYAIPGVSQEMTYPMVSKLSGELRLQVASSLNYDVKHVEVLWIPVETAVNTGSLNIEVLYSVKPDFNPDDKTREDLAQSLVDLVAGFSWLPDSVTEVTSWILPQHDAVYKKAKRPVDSRKFPT